jgi:predicted ATP-grasp superfamily ATP-dependent carboligase
MQPPVDALGAGSVTRYVARPDIAEMHRTLLQALGASGLVGTQYLIEAGTGIPYLIEINRRMVPATHTGSRVGVDLAAALAAVMGSHDWTGPTDLAAENERSLALFPQEWLRDPSSAHLERLPTDAPWDDPQLFEAMLALRAPRKT